MRKKLAAFLLFMLIVFAPAQAYEASIDDMIGQMIIIGFKGNDIKDSGFKKVLNQLEQNKISGVVFTENNIKNKDSLLILTKALNASKAKERPFIATDWNGGKYSPFNHKNGFSDIADASSVAKMSKEEAYKVYYLMASELSSMLFNLNLGPCVDLDLNKNSIVHKRQMSYSSNPQTVMDYASQFIKAHYDKNIITSLKHFPGYGGSVGDKDLSYADSTKTASQRELIPYMELTKLNNIQTVSVSHIYNRNTDTIYPASLSYFLVYGLLRKQLDYDGVVITDALDLPSIANSFNLDEIVIQAINAGCDILYFENNNNKYDPSLPDKINNIIKAAMIEGSIEPLRVEQSYKRIIKLKRNLILNEKKG